jgi:glycerophosphoryl diester phosphodiesterase
MREKILAHRGLWEEDREKNSILALNRALEMGFGIEYDVRDNAGELVISHDPPSGAQETFNQFLSLDIPTNAFHAINIKSDGLAHLFMDEFSTKLNKHPHVFFDMSYVESLKYRSAGMPVATRISEGESLSSATLDSDYLWVDALWTNWWVEKEHKFFVREGGAAPIFVSPELHGRAYEDSWKWLRGAASTGFDFMICTDFPLKAEEFIYG